MKTLIVYYSLEGNTEYAARRIAAEIGADLLRLEPVNGYPDKGLRKFLWGGKSAVMAETPELVPYEFDADAYDRILFGFPVWAGTLAPPIRTFVRDNILAGKRIAAFACQSAAGAEKAFGKLRQCLEIDSLEAEVVLIDPKTRPGEKNEQLIRDFCRRLAGEL